MAENNPIAGETDLEIHCGCGLPGEIASDVPQRQGMSSTLGR